MSNSFYPVLWAMKHAPVADALERLILIAMADASDSDGCNSFRSYKTHTLIAKGVDEDTIRRRQRAMELRGLIRKDETPPPARYLKIPRGRQPKRWEICIPYSWWSDTQRAEIQRERADQGLPPITPQSRPDLPDAPEKGHRADKGKPNPNRRRKITRQAEGVKLQRAAARGLSERPLETDGRGLSERPQGVSQRDPTFLGFPSPRTFPLPPSAPPAAGCGFGWGCGGREEG